MPKAAVAVETLRALAAPRRLIPILVVVTPLLGEQAQSRAPGAVIVGASLCAACVIVAPVTWRVLTEKGATIPRVLFYAAIGAVLVLGIGALVPRMIHLGPSFLTVRWSLGISLALYWVGGFGLGRDIELEQSLITQRARAEALAREAERAELLAMRAHLDPHFLFNTLNAIAEWCRVDGAIAEQAVLRLAEMLRAVLAGVRAEWWPAEREIALVEAVFELYRTRDPARFTVARDVDDGALRIPIPPLLLLPLADNAMKHGPAAGHEGEVRFSIKRHGSGLRVELSNPGQYTGPRPGSDGLPTVERRLALSYGGRARLSIEGNGERTRVVLDLPDTKEEP